MSCRLTTYLSSVYRRTDGAFDLLVFARTLKDVELKGVNCMQWRKICELVDIKFSRTQNDEFCNLLRSFFEKTVIVLRSPRLNEAVRKFRSVVQHDFKRCNLMRIGTEEIDENLYCVWVSLEGIEAIFLDSVR